jgi:gamma-glutamyltranspeptidase/glutathione hydrolase
MIERGRLHRRGLVLAIVIWMGGCTRSPGVAPAATPAPALTSAYIPRDWPLIAETDTVAAKHAMVVSVHPLASEVGAVIMRRGGNAVDAAVAVGFALAVVHPAAGNIGGGGFMVIRDPAGGTYALDYRETAPSGATRDMFVDENGKLTDASVTGALAAGVPGSVAGLAEAERRFGRLSLAEVMAPAIRLARDGFALDASRARGIAAAERRLSRFEASRNTFLTDDGQAPSTGTLFVQPDLARTLQSIADSGAKVFYQGHIADLIVAEIERDGGLISKRDLAGYTPIWRDPTQVSYRGYTIYSMPPSSSGGITMGETLNIVEALGPVPPFGSTAQVHVLAEAMRRAFTDRNHYLGDPAFVEAPVSRLLSKSYAAELSRTIDPQRATPSADVQPGLGEGNHTTHYSVVDPDGMAVAVTTTINSGFGSAVTVAGAGFLLNNEMDDFTGAPGQPNIYGLIQGEANAVGPGKRMLSAMSPTIVLDPNGKLFLIVGTPGGPTIITTVTQVISHVIDHAMSLAQAVGAPRIHHQGLPDEVEYERGGLQPSVIQALEEAGYRLVEREGYSGEVAAIIRSRDGWIGVADPRSGGEAVGY